MATNKIYTEKTSYEDLLYDGVEVIGDKLKKQWENVTGRYENILEDSKEEVVSISKQLLSNMYVMYSQQLVFNQINNIKRQILRKVGVFKKSATSLLDLKRGGYGDFVPTTPIKKEDDGIENIDEKVLDFVDNSKKIVINGKPEDDVDIVKVALGKRHEYFKDKELNYIILKNQLTTEKVNAEIRGGQLNPQVKMKEIFDLQKENFKWDDINKDRTSLNNIYTKKEFETREDKLPNWKSLAVSSEIDSNDEYIDYYKKTDTVPFYVYDLINKKYIFFKNTISTITDSSNFSWNEEVGIGKPDPFFDFVGFDKNQNITFTIIIESLKEITPTFNKINYLERMCYPNYNGNMMTSNIIRITVGDFIKDKLVFLNSLFINPDDQEIGWFFRNNNYYSDNINGEFYNEDIKDIDKKLPMKIDVTMDFTIMFEELPENKNKEAQQ